MKFKMVRILGLYTPDNPRSNILTCTCSGIFSEVTLPRTGDSIVIDQDDWFECDVWKVRHYPKKDGRMTLPEVWINDYIEDISQVVSEFDGENKDWSADIPMSSQIKAAKEYLSFYADELKEVGFTEFVWEEKTEA